jgi:hypothetical protein
MIAVDTGVPAYANLALLQVSLAHNGKGQIVEVLSEGLTHLAPRVRLVPGLSSASGEIAQGPQAALPNYFVGGLENGGEHSAHDARFDADGAKRKRKVTLLWIRVSAEHQPQVVGPGGLARGHYSVEHRSDRVPDFCPTIATFLAERPRMLAAKNRAVRVVVKDHIFRSPIHHDWKARS